MVFPMEISEPNSPHLNETLLAARRSAALGAAGTSRGLAGLLGRRGRRRSSTSAATRHRLDVAIWHKANQAIIKPLDSKMHSCTFQDGRGQVFARWCPWVASSFDDVAHVRHLVASYDQDLDYTLSCDEHRSGFASVCTHTIY